MNFETFAGDTTLRVYESSILSKTWYLACCHVRGGGSKEDKCNWFQKCQHTLSILEERTCMTTYLPHIKYKSVQKLIDYHMKY